MCWSRCWCGLFRPGDGGDTGWGEAATRYPLPSSVLGPSLSLYCPDTRKLPRRDSVHIPLRALQSEENISSSKCFINQLRNNHYELSNTTLDKHQNCKIDSFLHPITKVVRCLLLSELFRLLVTVMTVQCTPRNVPIPTLEQWSGAKSSNATTGDANKMPSWI